MSKNQSEISDSMYVDFTVNYNLAFLDVHTKEEIDEKSLKKWEDNVEPYFEDDYSNILFQNKFNKSLVEKLEIKSDYLIQTRFDTLITSLTLRRVKLI